MSYIITGREVRFEPTDAIKQIVILKLIQIMPIVLTLVTVAMQ